MDFKLPDIGEGIHEGEVTKWLVKEGDKINADAPMVQVMTDKATVEIPSPVSGVIEKLFAKEGETVKVGSVLVRIRENGKVVDKVAQPKVEAVQRVAKTSTSQQMVTDKPSATKKPYISDPPPVIKDTFVSEKSLIKEELVPVRVLATPATRKMARELGVDLNRVNGTGTHGRVTKLDVQMHYEGKVAAEPRTSHPVSVSEAIVSSQLTRSIVPQTGQTVAPLTVRGAIQRVPLRGIRKKIAEAMSYSRKTAAHFTYVEEVDMTEIVKLREAVLKEAQSRGVKITFLPFIIKAIIPALKDFPYLNSSLDDASGEIILKGDYNIGIATDTEQGLMVPVVKNADKKTMWELASEISQLSEKARSGQSDLNDLRGGTFSITNAGSIGGVFATPIINYPEVAILGVNAIRKRPVVVDDQIVIRNMMFLSLSVDHRVVDGAYAARFMNRVVFYLSDPKRLVFV